MDPAILNSAVRRFPLLGRPRPPCLPLATRIDDITQAASITLRKLPDGLAQAADVLNRAALVASDCGLNELARDLCWQHIYAYLSGDQPLTYLQARRMLEPVLNLARLAIRAGDHQEALQQFSAMYQAVSESHDLVLNGQRLPLANLAGTTNQRRSLLEFAYLHLLGDGIRALAKTGQWDAAVTHARAHRGIGLHLLEGRQALIIARCLNGKSKQATQALQEATPEKPWEQLVAPCLKLMCSNDPHQSRKAADLMIHKFLQHTPVPGYALFHTQLGLTVATLAARTSPQSAANILTQAADETIKTMDGYAARELLQHHENEPFLTSGTENSLQLITRAAGLLPPIPNRQVTPGLLAAASTAVTVIRRSVTAG